MKYIALIVLALVNFYRAGQDIYTCKNAKINMFSSAPIEDIEANSTEGVSVYNAATGDLAFSVPIRSLHFEKSLMEEHFNENYMESDKYPKATFSGTYTGSVQLNKDGVYQVTIKGNLSLHNATKAIEVPATIEVKNGHLLGKTEFKVKPEDFNIAIPSVVRDKIDKEITVKVNIDCAAK